MKYLLDGKHYGMDMGMEQKYSDSSVHSVYSPHVRPCWRERQGELDGGEDPPLMLCFWRGRGPVSRMLQRC